MTNPGFPKPIFRLAAFPDMSQKDPPPSMKSIPLLLTLSVLAFAVAPLPSLRADDTSNRRDYKSPDGGMILFGGTGDNGSPAGTAVAPGAGGQTTSPAGVATAGSAGGSSSAVASTPPVPAVPATPPPPPPQRSSNRRSFNDPNGGVSIWLPNLLNGPKVPEGPPQPGNRRNYP